MSELAAFQARFADALLAARGPDAPPPGAVDADWADRFAVYRNNVVTALADGVVKSYPAVDALLGRANMRIAAAAYVRAHPPRARALTLAFAGFAAFLRNFPPTAGAPHIPGAAALDRAWLESLYADDAAPLDTAALAGFAPGALADLAPGLVAHARLVSVAPDVYAAWVRARGFDEGEAPARGRGAVLFWRPDYARHRPSVRRRRLDRGEAAFVTALAAGASLGAAGAKAVAALSTFDVAAVFAGLLAAGVLARPQGEGM